MSTVSDWGREIFAEALRSGWNCSEAFGSALKSTTPQSNFFYHQVGPSTNWKTIGKTTIDSMLLHS